MRRIGLAVVLGLSVGLGSPDAQAQPPAAKVYRIGFLFELTRSSAVEDRWRAAFHRRGYVVGQNAVFEFRWAGERFEHLQAPAEELVRLKVDVIVTGSTPPAVAARRATATIPIITQSGDPIRCG